MQLKERALGHADPRGTEPTRFRPKDRLLAFLESLDYAGSDFRPR